TRRRVFEVAVVDDVIELGAEFDISRLPDDESFTQREIQLHKMRTFKRIAREIAECARLWHGKSSGIEISKTAAAQNRINGGNPVRPANISTVSTAWRVDDGSSKDRPVGGNDWIRNKGSVSIIQVHDIGTRDKHLNRQS